LLFMLAGIPGVRNPKRTSGTWRLADHTPFLF